MEAAVHLDLRPLALLPNFGPVVLTDFGSSPVPQPTVARLDRGTWRGLESQRDLFEQLRREHEFGIGTIAGVAAKFGVHRRLVRQAIGNELPPKHRCPARAKPKLGAVAAFIDEVWKLTARAPPQRRRSIPR